jgi:hypothetical protein
VSVAPSFPRDDSPLSRWQRGALIAGAVGLTACLVAGLIPDTRVAMFRAWLVAFNFCLGLALGSLVVLMLQYLTGGVWGYIIRRPLEAATRTLPLLTVLFLPLLLGLGTLYVWADPEKVAADEDLQHKMPYLNVPWFIVRAACCFAIWNGLQVLLNRWSKQYDETRDPRLNELRQGVSAAGMLLYVITITVASIDWVMSLEPHWYSTIYGAMFGMGQVLSGFAFSIVVFLLLADRPPLDAVAAPANLRDLGSLLLAFVMVWAYLSFDQFLLIWSGNLPEEVPWYIARLEHGWVYVALALVLFHFALPFVLLLSTNVKRHRRRLATVALLVVVMHVVDLSWLIVPAFSHGHGQGSEEHGSLVIAVLLYTAALAGIGGVWLGEYLRQIQRLPLLAVAEMEGGVAHGQAAAHH